MKDAAAYFRQLLLAQTGVTAIVKQRVYEAPLPSQPTLPAISYGASTGKGTTGEGWQERYFAVLCWAETRDAAVALSNAVADGLAAPGRDVQLVNGEYICGIEQTGGESVMVDEDTRWFVVETEYRIALGV